MFSLLHDFTKVFQEGRLDCTLKLDAKALGFVTRQCKDNVKVKNLQVLGDLFIKVTNTTLGHEGNHVLNRKGHLSLLKHLIKLFNYEDIGKFLQVWGLDRQKACHDYQDRRRRQPRVFRNHIGSGNQNQVSG